MSIDTNIDSTAFVEHCKTHFATAMLLAMLREHGDESMLSIAEAALRGTWGASKKCESERRNHGTNISQES